MKTKLFFTTIVLFYLNTNAQSLNLTTYIGAPNSADAFRSGYTFAYASSGTPWNGSLLSFGGFSNNYDTQFNADYLSGNHISFRTRNGDIAAWNPWIELATKNSNNFIGNQNINGNLNIFNSINKIVGHGDPINYYMGTFPVVGSSGLDLHWYGGIRFGDSTSSSVMQITGGNVGIGTTTPKEKLQVEGGSIGIKLASDVGPAISLQNPMKTGVGGIWRIYNMTGSYGNSLQFWNYPQDYSTTHPRLILSDSGNMALLGKLEAKEIKITTTPTADFVFDESYILPNLHDTEKHIKQKKHLPEIASAKEMERDGVNIGEFQIKLLQKIEELTLYLIDQNKKIEALTFQNKQILELQKEITLLKSTHIK